MRIYGAFLVEIVKSEGLWKCQIMWWYFLLPWAWAKFSTWCKRYVQKSSILFHISQWPKLKSCSWTLNILHIQAVCIASTSTQQQRARRARSLVCTIPARALARFNCREPVYHAYCKLSYTPIPEKNGQFSINSMQMSSWQHLQCAWACKASRGRSPARRSDGIDDACCVAGRASTSRPNGVGDACCLPMA